MAFKKCQQCGCILPEESFKVKYIRKDESKARANYCRQCELDTKTYYELQAKMDKRTCSVREEEVLHTFVSVFKKQESQGLRTPLSRSANSGRIAAPRDAHIKELEQRYTETRSAEAELYCSNIIPNKPTKEPVYCPEPDSTVENNPIEYIPEALQPWLTDSFESWYNNTLTPDYVNEVVYPMLKAEFRPEIGVDKVTALPVYDDTYKEILNTISTRFWEYEDWCYNKALGG